MDETSSSLRSAAAPGALLSLLLIAGCGGRPAVITDFSLLSEQADSYRDKELTIVGTLLICLGDTAALVSDAAGRKVMLMDDDIERVPVEEILASDSSLTLVDLASASAAGGASAGQRVALDARLLPFVTPLGFDSELSRPSKCRTSPRRSAVARSWSVNPWYDAKS